MPGNDGAREGWAIRVVLRERGWLVGLPGQHSTYTSTRMLPDCYSEVPITYDGLSRLLSYNESDTGCSTLAAVMAVVTRPS